MAVTLNDYFPKNDPALAGSQRLTQPTTSVAPPPIREQLAALLPKLLMHALRLTRSKQTAEDLVQNTCVRAIERLDQWQLTGSFEGWVVKIMENLWFNQLRQIRQRQEQEIENPDLIPDAGFENQANAKLLLDTLHDRGIVSEEDFSLLMKIHLYGLSYREVADEYGTPIGTLLSRVSRTKTALQKAVKELDREGCA